MQQHLPSEPSRGRPRTHALREIFDAIFYILRDFLCVALFALQFPAMANGVLPFSTFASQRNLVSPAHCLSNCRTRACGQERAAECSDHRCDIRVKTVEESASICGFDAHKHVKGRKRHILVDTLASCWRSTSPLPISTIVKVPSACSPDSPHCCHASKRSGPMERIGGKSWPPGARPRATGT